MKKSEIEVGKDYAYESYKGAHRIRVTVESLDAPGKGSYGQPVKGIFVREVSERAHGWVTTGRNIVSPWAEEALRRDEAAKQRIQYRQWRREARREKAPKIKRLLDLFERAGLPIDQPVWLPSGNANSTPLECAQDAAEDGFHAFFNENNQVYLLLPEGLAKAYYLGIEISLSVDNLLALIDAVEFSDPDRTTDLEGDEI
jgi:hypothetical protein